MTQEQHAILGELNKRVQASHNGALVLFNKAGLPIKGSITLADVKAMYEQQPAVYEELIAFLYPEHAKAAAEDPAVATSRGVSGGVDWKNSWAGMLGGVLTGLGNGILGSYNYSSNEQAMQYEYAMLQQQSQQQKKTTYLVLGIFGVLIVAGIVAAFAIHKK